MNIHYTHKSYMARCLYLAGLGRSFTSPNPMVGAVIVHQQKIIGEGFHKRYGEAHAEPNAIQSVRDKSLLKESTLYVSLEPCSHYGKTPPCADLIVRMGIPHVVIATLDPNPKVAGRGVEILRKAGIEVEIGILEKEARELNKRFFSLQEKQRPYIILKWAQTSNGFMDVIRSDYHTPPLHISNAVTQQLTHKMRAENMAIMVGTNTVMLDNPALTLRLWHGRSPIRLAIDRKGIVGHHFQLKNGKVSTYIFTENDKKNEFNLEYPKISDKKNNLKEILYYLYKKNIHSVLVEGGATLLNSLIEEGCWDEANIETAPFTVNNGIKAPILRDAWIEFEKMIENHSWTHYRKTLPDEPEKHL